MEKVTQEKKTLPPDTWRLHSEMITPHCSAVKFPWIVGSTYTIIIPLDPYS
jgi:hypothetical protein